MRPAAGPQGTSGVGASCYTFRVDHKADVYTGVLQPGQFLHLAYKLENISVLSVADVALP